MTNWKNYSDLVTANSLSKNFINVEHPPQSKKLYFGRSGFKLFDLKDKPGEFVEVTQSVFNEMVEETFSKLESEEDLNQLNALRDRISQSYRSDTTQDVALDTFGLVKEKTAVSREVKTICQDYVQKYSNLAMNDLDDVNKTKIRQDRLNLIKNLLENKYNKIPKLSFPKTVSKADQDQIDITKQEIESYRVSFKNFLEAEYKQDIFELEARNDRAWQRNCSPHRIEYLLKQRVEGSYLLHTDEYDSVTFCSYMEKGELKKVELNFRKDASTLADAIGKLIRNPKPIRTKPLSFYQAQLDWHATDKKPKDVLVPVYLPGTCCITRTDDPNQFTIHVMMKDHSITEFAIEADAYGIYATVKNLNGSVNYVIEAERLHELFENEDFPGSFFSYEQFEYQGKNAHTIEEIYYRTMMAKIPISGDEFYVVKPEFSATSIAVGNRGSFINLIDTTAETEFDSGCFKELHMTEIHPMSVSEAEYLLVKPKSKPYPTWKTKTQFKKTINNIKKIRHTGVTLNYNLLPNLIKSSNISGNKTEGLLTKRALGGTLNHYNGKLNSKQQLMVARDLFEGLKELKDIGIIKGDIKPENVLCLTEDKNNLQAKHADFDEITIFDENTNIEEIVNPYPMLSLQYSTPSIIKNYSSLTIQDHLNNAIYSTAAIIFELMTDKSPGFGRVAEKKVYLLGDPLDPYKVVESFKLPKDAIMIKDDGSLEWKEKDKDSLAHILVECLLIDQPRISEEKNTITIEEVIKRIENLPK